MAHMATKFCAVYFDDARHAREPQYMFGPPRERAIKISMVIFSELLYHHARGHGN